MSRRALPPARREASSAHRAHPPARREVPAS